MVIKKGNFFNNSSTHSEVEILQNNHDNCGKIRNGYKPKNPLPFQFSDNSTHTPIIEIGRNGYKHKIPVTHKISDTISHGRDIEFDCGNYSISTSTETGTSNTDCNLSWDYERKYIAIISGWKLLFNPFTNKVKNSQTYFKNLTVLTPQDFKNMSGHFSFLIFRRVNQPDRKGLLKPCELICLLVKIF